MKKVLIIYQSKKGHTRKYGEEIGKLLSEKGIESNVFSVAEFKEEHLRQVSHLFLGCWTSGLFLLLQHPDKVWIECIRKISIPKDVKTGLFTTYKIATGSMFRVMKKYISAPGIDIMPEWRSKSGLLSEADKEGIIRFING